MNKFRFVFSIFFLSLVISFFLINCSEKAQTEPLNSGNMRAAVGDTVLVILYEVAPEKQEQYEKFYREILFKGAEKLDDSHPDKQLFKQTRMLLPTTKNKAGNVVYVWLMDPLSPTATNDIRHLLREFHPEEKIEEYFKMWQESFVSVKVHKVVQSDI